MITIFVVYTDKVLSVEQIRQNKKYSFNTNSDINVGDMLKSNKYANSMQVVNKLDKSFKYYNKSTGDLSNELTSSNQNEIVQLEIRNDAEEIVYASKIA